MEFELLQAAKDGGDLLSYLLIYIVYKLNDHDKRIAALEVSV